jgi:general secretion pathway protein G
MLAKKPGFSMVELLLVVTIIGILTAVMLPGFKAAMNKVYRFKTDRILDKVEMALSLYNIDMSSFPGRQAGYLNALVSKPASVDSSDYKGPYLSEEGMSMAIADNGLLEIKDGWGRALEYNNPPVNFPGKYKNYELLSYGANENDQTGYIVRGR